MSFVSLVDYVHATDNYNERKRPVDRITVHHVVGELTAEGIAGCFPATRMASCNYGIGCDGQVMGMVHDENRSWCSSSQDNDTRAITIECADSPTPPYEFSNVVYDRLIDLCVALCEKFGKKRLTWNPDKNETLNRTPDSDEMVLTVHRWFSATACPGTWMMEHMSDLADKVTVRLGGTTVSDTDTLYRVQVGAFMAPENAERYAEELELLGYDTYIVTVGKFKKVQLGAFAEEDNAYNLCVELAGKGYETIITTNEVTLDGINVGDTVKIKSGAKSYEGVTMLDYVYNNTYRVDAISGDRAVLDKAGLCTAFRISDLIEV